MVWYAVPIRSLEKPMRQKRRYLAYLLRLWQEGASPGGKALGERPLWRASLERPQSGERLGFASLEDLFSFLEEETGSDASGSKRADASGRR
jgi:hypothetical protein